jgi:hypothetical protein
MPFFSSKPPLTTPTSDIIPKEAKDKFVIYKIIVKSEDSIEVRPIMNEHRQRYIAVEITDKYDGTLRTARRAVPIHELVPTRFDSLAYMRAIAAFSAVSTELKKHHGFTFPSSPRFYSHTPHFHSYTPVESEILDLAIGGEFFAKLTQKADGTIDQSFYLTYDFELPFKASWFESRGAPAPGTWIPLAM